MGRTGFCRLYWNGPGYLFRRNLEPGGSLSRWPGAHGVCGTAVCGPGGGTVGLRFIACPCVQILPLRQWRRRSGRDPRLPVGAVLSAAHIGGGGAAGRMPARPTERSEGEPAGGAGSRQTLRAERPAAASTARWGGEPGVGRRAAAGRRIWAG